MNDKSDFVERQLNPFAFPSETDARFILLIFSALALAFALADPLLQLINPEAGDFTYNYPAAPLEGLPPEEYFTQNITFGLQMATVALKALTTPAIFFLITICLATLIYWNHPRQVRINKKIKELGVTKDKQLEQEIQTLSKEAGLSDVPRIELGNDLTEVAGQAFGSGKSKTLWLGGGIRLLLRKSPETFRAIVRHELAHIANRDISRTYFAQALWISVVLVTVTPLFLLTTFIVLRSTFHVIADGVSYADLRMLFLTKYPAYFWVTIQCLALIAVIAWIWAGILRVREIYADWRAMIWGSKQSLMTILNQPEKRARKNFRPRFHPSWAERLSVLRYPRKLFDMAVDLPFIVGLLTAVVLGGAIPIFLKISFALEPLSNSFSSWLILFARDHPGWWMPFFRVIINAGLAFAWFGGFLVFFLPVAMIAHLYATTLGLQVQRQAMADLVEHKVGIIPYLYLFVPAGMTSIGFFAGLFIAPFSFLTPVSFSSGFLILLLLLDNSIFLWLILISLRFCSQRILGLHIGTVHPKGKFRLINSLAYLSFLGVIISFIVLLVFINGSVANNTDIKSAFLILIAVSVLIPIFQVGGFMLQYLILSAYRSLRRVQCPTCGKPLPKEGCAGIKCSHCSAALGHWLFVS